MRGRRCSGVGRRYYQHSSVGFVVRSRSRSRFGSVRSFVLGLVSSLGWLRFGLLFCFDLLRFLVFRLVSFFGFRLVSFWSFVLFGFVLPRVLSSRFVLFRSYCLASFCLVSIILSRLFFRLVLFVLFSFRSSRLDGCKCRRGYGRRGGGWRGVGGDGGRGGMWAAMVGVIVGVGGIWKQTGSLPIARVVCVCGGGGLL